MPPAAVILRDRLLDLWADRAVALSRRYGPMPAALFVWHMWPTRVNIGRRKASKRT